MTFAYCGVFYVLALELKSLKRGKLMDNKEIDNNEVKNAEVENTAEAENAEVKETAETESNAEVEENTEAGEAEASNAEVEETAEATTETGETAEAGETETGEAETSNAEAEAVTANTATKKKVPKGLKILGIVVAVIVVIAIIAVIFIAVVTQKQSDTDENLVAVGGMVESETVEYSLEETEDLQSNPIIKFMEMVWYFCCEGDNAKHADQTPPDVEMIKDIAYVDDGNIYHQLDVFYPEGTDEDDELPVIIDIHGGGWMYATKDLNEYYCRALADRGYVVFSISYRLVPDVTVVEQLQDVALALQWIQENLDNYPCSGDDIILTGDSAGGMLAIYSSVLLQSSELREVFGTVDAGMDIGALILTSPVAYMDDAGWLSVYTRILWGTDYKEKATYEYMDVDAILDYATNIPPTYLITSSKDTLAHSQTEDLYELLVEYGANVEIADYDASDYDSDTKLPHVFSVLYPFDDVSVEAIDSALEFCDSAINIDLSQYLTYEDTTELAESSAIDIMANIWGINDLNDEARYAEYVESGVLPDVNIIEDVAYYDDGSEYHLLDIYYPDDADENTPIVIDIHGGGWMMGTKDLNEPFCRAVADRGYVVYSISYSLVPDVTVETQLQECMIALWWIQNNMQNYPGDTSSIMLAGDSAGGQLAGYCAVLLESEYLREIFNVIDAGMHLDALLLISPVAYMGTGSLAAYTRLMWGLDYDERDTYPYMDISDIIPLADYIPPTYLITSTGDTMAEEQTQMLSACLDENGIENVLMDYGKYDGESLGHVFCVSYPFEDSGVEAIDAFIEFYEEVLAR